MHEDTLAMLKATHEFSGARKSGTVEVNPVAPSQMYLKWRPVEGCSDTPVGTLKQCEKKRKENQPEFKEGHLLFFLLPSLSADLFFLSVCLHSLVFPFISFY